MFDVVVIGGGLIGASATRHLCKAGLSVAVIAPPEPDRPISHRGPFGAYYDVSRSSRTLYVDPVELELSRSAQAANPEIEDHSHEKRRPQTIRREPRGSSWGIYRGPSPTINWERPAAAS